MLKLAEAITNLDASTTSPNPPPSPEDAVQAVSITLPEFWSDDPEVWLLRVEAQLRARSVTQDQTKFDYVVGALDNRTAAEIKSVLISPPQHNKYEAIKTALLSAYGKTQTQKDTELLNISGLRDCKPSSFLRHLEALNNDAGTLRQAFFLSQLPAQIRRCKS